MCSAEVQSEHNDFAVIDGESAGNVFIATGEVSAHLYATPGSNIYVHYSTARKRLLKKVFVMEKVESEQTSVFVGHRYVQHTEREWRKDHCI